MFSWRRRTQAIKQTTVLFFMLTNFLALLSLHQVPLSFMSLSMVFRPLASKSCSVLASSDSKPFFLLVIFRRRTSLWTLPLLRPALVQILLNIALPAEYHQKVGLSLLVFSSLLLYLSLIYKVMQQTLQQTFIHFTHELTYLSALYANYDWLLGLLCVLDWTLSIPIGTCFYWQLSCSYCRQWMLSIPFVYLWIFGKNKLNDVVHHIIW